MRIEPHNLIAVGIAPGLSDEGLCVLPRAIAAAEVPVQVTVGPGRWITAAD